MGVIDFLKSQIDHGIKVAGSIEFQEWKDLLRFLRLKSSKVKHKKKTGERPKGESKHDVA